MELRIISEVELVKIVSSVSFALNRPNSSLCVCNSCSHTQPHPELASHATGTGYVNMQLTRPDLAGGAYCTAQIGPM